MRRWRGVAERLLGRVTLASVIRRRIGGKALILAYHNVVPDELQGIGDSSLHAPRSLFARHLDLVQSTCDVVSLSVILKGKRTVDRPVVAITFDDAYLGAVTIGGPELVRRGLPATFFVAPGCLGRHAFWWDEFREPGGDPLTPTTQEFLLRELKGDDSEIRSWGSQHLAKIEVPELLRTSSREEVDRLANSAGMEIGAHSWSHPNLAALDPERLRSELVRPLEWLRTEQPRHIRALAFPYGRHSPMALQLAGEAGYTAALGINGGWAGSGDALLLPRLNIPSGISVNGLGLRLAGWVPR